MRIMPLALVLVLSLAAATNTPASAQGGGKKHHKPDSTSAATTATTTTATASTGVAAQPKNTSAMTANLPAEITPINPGDDTKSGNKKNKSNKPVVIDWQFRGGPGYARLTLDPDGSYLFSGKYVDPNNTTPSGDADPDSVSLDVNIMLTVKNSRGDMLIYHATGPAKRLEWSHSGTNPFLKDQFQTFVTKHPWMGTYKVMLTPYGARTLYHWCETMIATFPPEWWNKKAHELYWGWSPAELKEVKQDCPNPDKPFPKK